jgi:CheY-like chemotaxis protein
MIRGGKPLRRVLVVDDDPDHRVLARVALRHHSDGAHIEVDTVSSGEDALAYLRREEPYAESQRPHLMLLDLRMPGVDGFAVLQAAREDPDLRALPIIVLSSSDHPDDVNRAYELGTNSYLTKQVTFRPGGMAAVADYWFESALLPDSDV